MEKNILEILGLEKEQLIFFLRFSAGLSHSVFGGKFGGTVGGKYNLRLQQIPEEYASFLLFIKDLEINSYLELGVGQGGSFFLNSLFQENTKIFHAVDNCDYQSKVSHFSDQRVSIKNYISQLKDLKKNENIEFFDMPTEAFFKNNKNLYDVIFIDADHSYEGVKEDYENSLKYLNSNGYLIFHDIANKGVGVKKLWDELDKSKKIHEFIYSHNCGIGIYKP